MTAFNPNPSPKKSRLWISPQHRLIVYNDAAYKEELAIRLNWRNVVIFSVVVGLFLLGFALLTLRLFADNGQKTTVITGDDNMRDQLIAINGQLDSLLKEIDARDVYIAQINKKINGEFEYQSDADRQLAENNSKGDEKDKKSSRKEKMPARAPETEKIIRSSKGESELANNSNQFSGVNLPPNSQNFSFTSPLKGIIADSFAPSRNRYGLNISAPIGAEVRATQNGMVVIASWAADMGYFILIQHPNNLISIYKNNSALLKKQGDRVEAGDIIAVVGNSKGKNAQAQLNFELWHYGLPLNPQKLIAFQ